MKIAVIGKGNVGSHLYKAFSAFPDKVEVRLIDSRSLEGLDHSFTHIVIAVSDDAIAEVARSASGSLPGFKGIAVHVSGSVDIGEIQPFFENYGVLYPLQTFSKEADNIDYGEIPVFIEGSSEEVKDEIVRLGFLISDNVTPLASEGRRRLHLASVFACNFTNAMYCMADEILQQEGIPFSALLPLIGQTASKVKSLSPSGCQTGPARRGDNVVVGKHMEMLASSPRKREIYCAVSDYITEKFKTD